MPVTRSPYFPNGTAAAPSIRALAEATGFYLDGAGKLRHSRLGVAGPYFTAHGLASSDAGDAAKYLRGDGTWGAVVPGGGDMLAADIPPLINPRAAQQGIEFNIPAAASMTALPAFRTFGFAVVFVVTPRTFAFSSNELLKGTINSPCIQIKNTGQIEVKKYGVASLLVSAATLVANQAAHIVINRNGGVLEVYKEGVFVDNVADATDFTAAITDLSRVTAAPESGLDGQIDVIGILDRGLSAAEILQIYKRGALLPAHFPSPAAGTQLVTGDDSTFASNTGFWTLIGGGATIAGGKLNIVTVGHVGRNATLLVQGQHYRVAGTVSNFAGAGTVRAESQSGNLYASVAADGLLSGDFVAMDTSLQFAVTGTATASVDDVTVQPLGARCAPQRGGGGCGPQLMDTSGCLADINLPGDGESAGVVWPLRNPVGGVFRYTRTSSGYLIADQLVIPPGCSVQVWAKGDGGTFSLGDTAGTPASIVNGQVAPAALSPIAQAGYVTANRKLYLTLGTAATVTVRIEIKKAP